MTISHRTLTDPELHEPKGTSTATVGQVYAADGAGSGDWSKPFKYVSVNRTFSTASPYTHVMTGTDTVLNPTVSTINNSEFTVQTSPNLRFRYDGGETLIGSAVMSANIMQSSGGIKSIQIVLYKNGSQLAGSRMVVSANTAEWTQVLITHHLSLVDGDYIEVFAQDGGSTSYNVDYAKFYFSIEGHVV